VPRDKKPPSRRKPHRAEDSRKRISRSGDCFLPIPTCGELFDDGGSIDLLFDPAAGRLALVSWDGRKYRIAPSVEHGGRIFRPVDLDPSILRAVTLPTSVSLYGSTEQLFTTVQQLLARYGFPAEVALAATFFLFSTWHIENLSIAPCLRIFGPEPEANLLLQLLGCLVRRSLSLGEVTRKSLCTVLEDLRPTLIVRREQQNSSAMRLLAASDNRHSYFQWKGGLVNIFCAKAIYYGNLLHNDFSNGLAVNLNPFREKLPVFHAKAAQETVAQLQSKLLAYRLQNISKVADSQFDVPEFNSGIRVLARAMGSCVVDAPHLQSQLIALLQDYQEKIRAQSWLDLRCVAIEALLSGCHKPEAADGKVYVGKSTEIVRAILKGRGRTTRLDPQAIGGIWRALDLSPKRDRHGCAIRLSEEVCRRIHKLAVDYDVAAMQDGQGHCAYCAEIVGGDSTEKRYTPTFRKDRG
jgi:hypothetical protein